MQRTLEIVFRHMRHLLLLLLVPLVAGIGIVFVLPRSYQSVAGLKAIQRYAVIGATGIEADLQATPAETQVTALDDFLGSPAFDLAVAYATALPKQVQASVGSRNQHVINDAIVRDLSTHVQVAAQAYNRYTITYANSDATIAQHVIQSIVRTFAVEGPAFAALGGQKLLALDQRELTADLSQRDAAVNAEAAYAAAHPSLPANALQTDPHYVVLLGEAQRTQQTVLNLEIAMTTIHQEIDQLSSSNTLFTVVDAPSFPYQAVSRLKSLAIGAGGGLAVALLACALYLALLYRRDHAIYTPHDVEQLPGLPRVILQIPRLAASEASQPQAFDLSGLPFFRGSSDGRAGEQHEGESGEVVAGAARRGGHVGWQGRYVGAVTVPQGAPQARRVHGYGGGGAERVVPDLRALVGKLGRWRRQRTRDAHRDSPATDST
jgi:hypothetical protein